MSVLSFLGRLLIATAIISSAYSHFEHPTRSSTECITNYKNVDLLSNKYLDVDIPFDDTNWPKVIKFFGGIEAIVAFLVIFGDFAGVVIYLVSVIIETLFLFLPKIMSNSVHIIGAWRSSEKQEASRLICLIGVGLLLLAYSNQTKKAAK